jgi:hypothetical protein
MKTTYLIVEVKHDKDLPLLPDMVAGRAYTIDGVRDAAAWVSNDEAQELRRAGFTLQEISLGAQDLVR